MTDTAGPQSFVTVFTSDAFTQPFSPQSRCMTPSRMQTPAPGLVLRDMPRGKPGPDVVLLRRFRTAMWRLTSKPAPITVHDGVFIVVVDRESAEELADSIESLVKFAEDVKRFVD